MLPVCVTGVTSAMTAAALATHIGLLRSSVKIRENAMIFLPGKCIVFILVLEKKTNYPKIITYIFDKSKKMTIIF